MKCTRHELTDRSDGTASCWGAVVENKYSESVTGSNRTQTSCLHFFIVSISCQTYFNEMAQPKHDYNSILKVQYSES